MTLERTVSRVNDIERAYASRRLRNYNPSRKSPDAVRIHVDHSDQTPVIIELMTIMQAATDLAWKVFRDEGATADRERLVEGCVVEQLLAEDRSGQSKRTPLAGAVKSGNPIMFWKVYDEVKIRRPWDHLMVSITITPGLLARF